MPDPSITAVISTVFGNRSPVLEPALREVVMPSSPPSESAGGHRGPAASPLTPRLTWQESLILIAALVFAGFLWVRGVDLRTALVTAVSAVGVLVLVLVTPRGIVEIIRLLRDLVRHLGESNR